MLQDRWAALRTETIATPATKRLPARCRRARRRRLTGILLRKLAYECPFAARPPRCVWPTLDDVRPRTAKARRRFPPASIRFPPPKTLSAGASQRSSKQAIRHEFAPMSSRFRSPPLDPRNAVHARRKPSPRAGLPLSVLPGALRTP